MNAEFLKGVELLQRLDDNQLADILLLGVVKEYRKDDIIFEDGSAGDRFYVIYAVQSESARCTIRWAKRL